MVIKAFLPYSRDISRSLPLRRSIDMQPQAMDDQYIAHQLLVELLA